MSVNKRCEPYEQPKHDVVGVDSPAAVNTERFDEFPSAGPALMVFRKKAGIATKRIWRKNGRIEKDGSGCSSFTGGRARVLHLGEDAPLELLATFLKSVDKQEMLTYGISANADGSWVRAMTKEKFTEADSPDTAITRSNDHLAFADSPGVMSGDYDPPPGLPAMSPDELIDTLREVCPPLADVDILWRPSSGSCIYDSESGREEVGIKGQRLWVPVKDASDLTRFGALVNDRAILKGHGYVFISTAGSMEVRSLLDAAMFRPAQPDYVAGADVEQSSGIEQRLPDPKIYPGSRRILDTHLFTSLSYEEGEMLKAIKAQLINEARPEAERIRLEYRKTRTKKLTETFGYTEPMARDVVESRLGYDLLASDVLFFDHLVGQEGYTGTMVSEVLANPDAFDGKTLADPLEPDYRGTPGSIVAGKAKLYLNGSTHKPMINSFAHASQKYRLLYDCATLLELFEKQKDKREALDWVRPMLNAKLSKTDKTVVLQKAAKITGHNIRDLRGDLDSSESEQKRVRSKSEALRSKGDGRTMILVEPSDLKGMVDQVSNAMCADPQGKPLFNYCSAYATVYTQAPVSINLPDVDADFGATYPPMPVIGLYKAANMNTRISESILFCKADTNTGELKPSAIPRGLSESVLAEFEKSAPVLKGIIEHPTIDPTGRIMMAHGYDEETGLFLHLGGQSFLPVPVEPNKDDALAAYKFLREEVLADFPFATELDAVVAVSMFLSKVQVRFLAACPIYAVLATIQSSGKTELTNVVSLSIDGRPIATQPWPDGDEAEMKKTITACLREGHSLVMFDNVPDGHKVRSTHLAQAVTSEIHRDRVLGLSENVTSPANMMFALTGNNLSFSRDMPTRVMQCYLDPKRDDPQKRRFARANLKGWCLSNRNRTIQAVLRNAHKIG
jgi:hypothetical protein